MTIEIRQLIIRAVVDEGRAVTPGREGVPRVANEARRESSEAAVPEQGAEKRQAIVNACVREVLRKLERARER
jgi:hypothetical protein